MQWKFTVHQNAEVNVFLSSFFFVQGIGRRVGMTEWLVECCTTPERSDRGTPGSDPPAWTLPHHLNPHNRYQHHLSNLTKKLKTCQLKCPRPACSSHPSLSQFTGKGFRRVFLALFTSDNFYKVVNKSRLPPKLPTVMTSKLSQKRFWCCDESEIIIIEMIPVIHTVLQSICTMFVSSPTPFDGLE